MLRWVFLLWFRNYAALARPQRDSPVVAGRVADAAPEAQILVAIRPHARPPVFAELDHTDRTGRAGLEALPATAAAGMDVSANDLVDAIDVVSAVAEENTAAMAEMGLGAGEVSQAMENIAAISEENSAAAEEVSATVEEVGAQVEEVTASAQSLSAMAQGLQALVAQFKLPGAETYAKIPALQPVPMTFTSGASSGFRPELDEGGDGHRDKESLWL